MSRVVIRCVSLLAALAVVVGLHGLAHAQVENDLPEKAIGIHGALGTDVTLGLGVGAGVTLWIPMAGKFDIEAGGQAFYHNGSETTDEELHSYTEETKLAILAVRFNLLFDYDPRVTGLYYLAGTGVAATSVAWEERSATDTSLGTPLPNGGSKHEADGVTGAAIANIGLGYTLGSGLDLRVELPILIFLGEVGEATTFAPTLSLSLGYRFL